MKKIVALVLALLLVVGSSALAVYDPRIDGESKWEGEVTTITFTDRLPGIVLENNPILAQIEKAVGVRLDISVLDATTYNELLAVQIAGGDIPDMFYLWGNSSEPNFQKWAAEGLLVDLETLKDKLPNAFYYLTEEELAFGRVHSLDNKLFGLPRMQATNVHGIPYRKDWLDKLGLDLPVTPEDVFEYCVAVTTQDPDGNGINDTWGLFITEKGDKGGGLLDYNIREGFGLLPETIAYAELTAQPGFMDMMDWYHDLYEAGGIYPEFYIFQDTYEDQAKFKAGTVGCIFKTTNVDHYTNVSSSDLLKVDPNAWVVSGYPLQPNGTTIDDYDNFEHWVTPNNWGVFAISSAASEEAVDAACRFLDWGCTDEGCFFLNVGVEDYNWKEWEPDARIKTGFTAEEKEEKPARASAGGSYIMVQQRWMDGSKISFGGGTPEERADYQARYDFLFHNYKTFKNISTYPGYAELKEQNAELTADLSTWMCNYICGKITREEFTTWLDGTYNPAWEGVYDIVAAVDGPKPE